MDRSCSTFQGSGYACTCSVVWVQSGVRALFKATVPRCWQLAGLPACVHVWVRDLQCVFM